VAGYDELKKQGGLLLGHFTNTIIDLEALLNSSGKSSGDFMTVLSGKKRSKTNPKPLAKTRVESEKMIVKLA
jgi:hypothetical protein